MADVELIGLGKRYADQVAVADVSLQVPSGEFLALLGPSGCGKTTLLRMVAGLIEPSAGRIRVGEEDITRVPVHRRGLGLVFQSYALFPHLSVAENVAYGMRRQGVRGAALRARVDAALDLVKMRHLADRMPRQLSGGQQQRVALARAVAPRPRVLLLDEPLSNLDALLRDEMQIEIKRLQRDLGITSIFVTHDQAEALSMADRVCVLSQGRVQQLGTPEQVYHQPANGFVAGFIGRSNRLRGQVRAADAGGCVLDLDGGGTLRSNTASVPAGAAADVVIRYDAVRLTGSGPGPGPGRGPGPAAAPEALAGQVVLRSFSGAQVQLVVRLPSGLDLVAETPSYLPQAGFAPGTPVSVLVDPAAVFVAPCMVGP